MGSAVRVLRVSMSAAEIEPVIVLGSSDSVIRVFADGSPKDVVSIPLSATVSIPQSCGEGSGEGDGGSAVLKIADASVTVRKCVDGSFVDADGEGVPSCT